jgi:DNA-binding transcriptional regulator YdaS (Cro superfamily)
MKLDDYFRTTGRQKQAFARAIGVTPQMVSAYIKGDIWPSRERMELIVSETGGEVTPNDFLDVGEAAQ